MNVVGHQAVGRTEQSFPGGSVQHQFAEAVMDGIIQPAGAPIKNRQCPMNSGAALIKFGAEAREIIGARLAVHAGNLYQSLLTSSPTIFSRSRGHETLINTNPGKRE